MSWNYDGGSTSGTAGFERFIFWMIFLYVGFHLLIATVIFPPIGILGIIGLLRVKEWHGY